MRLSAPASAVLLSLASIAQMQTIPAQAVPPPPNPPAYTVSTPTAPALGPDLSRLLGQLTDQPATHTGLNFDRTALQVAQGMLASTGVDPARAAASLTGISFDTFHFQQPAFYTPEAMSALIEGYRQAGWKHMVNGNSTPANTAQPTKQNIDLWLHFTGADVDGIVVLTRGVKEMTVVHVSGDLRPLDLLHLSGHFGIPKVDPSAVMVPAP